MVKFQTKQFAFIVFKRKIDNQADKPSRTLDEGKGMQILNFNTSLPSDWSQKAKNKDLGLYLLKIDHLQQDLLKRGFIDSSRVLLTKNGGKK